jgi:hypothetical protein
MPLAVLTYEGTYTPTATGPTLSAGTITGRWWRTDRDVTAVIIYTFGAGDTFAGSATPFIFTLPFAASVALVASQCVLYIEDAGAGAFLGAVGPGSAADTTHTPQCWYVALATAPTPDTLGIQTWLTSQPMAWAAGDRVTVTCRYLAAQ